MAQTEAQLRASKKYHEKFETIQIRVLPHEKELIKEHAARRGESLNGFVQRAIVYTIACDDAAEQTESSDF